MKKAIKSSNQTNAYINKNFIIRVTVAEDKKEKLTSANKLSLYILDEKLKLKLFAKVLDSGADKHVFKVRNRLKIVFCSK